MKVTQEKLPASQIGLEIEITPEMSRDAYEKALRDFTRNVNIPGFRRGKVPRQILIQRLGSTRIKASVLEELIEETLKQAIEQEKIEALGNFQLRSSFEELVQSFEPGSELTFSAAVDVPPEPNLKQHQGLTVQAEEVKYDPAQVDQVIENYRERAATLVPVEDRPAQEKDIAVVDFTGRFAESDDESEEPKEIPGGSATDFQIELTEGRFIPGFVEGVIGMNPGETKDLNVAFPEDYLQEDLAGKAAVFTITLKELKEKELPELDDDFAQDVSEFETLSELRESLESQYQKEAEEKTRDNKEIALLKELVNQLEVEIPETLVSREVDNVVTQSVMQLARQGLDVKSLLTEEIVKDLRERARPEAVTRLRRTFALGKVAELEEISVEPSAISQRVNEVLQQYASEDLDINRVRETVEDDLLKEKIFDWLLDHCTVELVPEGTLTESEEEEETETEDETSAATSATETPEASTATVDVDATETPETEAPAAEEDAEVASPSPDEVEATEKVEGEQANEDEAKTVAKFTGRSRKKKDAESGDPALETDGEAEATSDTATTTPKTKSTKKKSSTASKSKSKPADQPEVTESASESGDDDATESTKATKTPRKRSKPKSSED